VAGMITLREADLRYPRLRRPFLKHWPKHPTGAGTACQERITCMAGSDQTSHSSGPCSGSRRSCSRGERPLG
jgi:hypothetical protein